MAGRLLEIALGSTWAPGVAAAAVTTGSGTEYHVFGHDWAGHLQHAYWSHGQWQVQNLGGESGGTPGAAYHDGRFDLVFYAGYRADLGWSRWIRVAP